MRKILSIITLALLTGCYYDSKEGLYPTIGDVCDTSNVTYSGDIQPMLQSSCYTCHSNANAAGSGGGIKLEKYDDVKIVALNGKLSGAINHASGYSPMPNPPGSAKLNSCSITKTDVWISKGALDN
jgi:hypothetical protein